MALSVYKTYVSAEVLYAVDLNGSIARLHDNPMSLISPYTANISAGGFDVTSMGELHFDDEGSATAVGRLRRSGNALHWHDATGSVALQAMIGGGLFGLTLSNSAGDPTNDIAIAAGAAVDSTEAQVLRLAASLTKQLDVLWAVGAGGGLDTGAIANGTYHVHLIKRVDTGVVDALFSTSATAPTMPTNYTLSRRIGSILRESAAIVGFIQDGDYFVRTDDGILDVDATNPTTSAVTRTLSIPAGINVWACFRVYSNAGSVGVIRDLATAGAAPSVTVAPLENFGSVGAAVAQDMRIRTDGSRQIETMNISSGGGEILRIVTYGWWDYRNRHAG